MTTDSCPSNRGPSEQRAEVARLRTQLAAVGAEVRDGKAVPTKGMPTEVSVFPNIWSPLPRPIGFVSASATTVTATVSTNDRFVAQYGRVDNGTTQGTPTQINFSTGSFAFVTLALPAKAVGDVLTIRVYGDPDVVSEDTVQIDVR